MAAVNDKQKKPKKSFKKKKKRISQTSEYALPKTSFGLLWPAPPPPLGEISPAAS
jgi:hypothetical protein